MQLAHFPAIRIRFISLRSLKSPDDLIDLLTEIQVLNLPTSWCICSRHK